MSIAPKILAFLPFIAYAGMYRVFRLRGEGWRSAALGAAYANEATAKPPQGQGE
jgi:hypothetical protein